MKQSLVGTRYAKALLQLSAEQNLLDRVYKDMLVINNVFLTNKDFLSLLKSPIIKTDKKLKIINQVFKDKISDLTKLFINIITKKKREGKFKDMVESFVRLYKKHKKIETVILTTALPVDEELKKEITGAIHSFTNKNIELEEVVNENILGGAIIRMGDKQLDASISSSLKALKQKFSKNLYSELVRLHSTSHIDVKFPVLKPLI